MNRRHISAELGALAGLVSNVRYRSTLEPNALDVSIRPDVQRFHQFLHPRSQLPAVVSLVNGAVAGLLSKAAVYPLDLAKKRLQIQGFAEHRRSYGLHFQCSGVWHCFQATVRQEGVLGAYCAYLRSLAPGWIDRLFAGRRPEVQNKPIFGGEQLAQCDTTRRTVDSTHLICTRCCCFFFINCFIVVRGPVRFSSEQLA